MKRFARIFTVFILSSLIMIGSGGFTIGKMICLGSGYISYSIGNAKDCCGEKSACASALASGCCDLKNVSLELPEFSISEKVEILNLQFCSFALTLICVPDLLFDICNSVFNSDISPLSLKEYLHFISSLRL